MSKEEGRKMRESERPELTCSSTGDGLYSSLSRLFRGAVVVNPEKGREKEIVWAPHTNLLESNKLFLCSFFFTSVQKGKSIRFISSQIQRSM